MIKRLVWLSIAGWFLAPTVATAQTGGGLRPGPRPVGLDKDLFSAADTGSLASKYEEIEIFRRILDAALLQKPLGRFTQVHSYGRAFSPDDKYLVGEKAVHLWDVFGSGKQLATYRDPVARWQGHEGLAIGEGPEGVYLPGYGFVFALTVPAQLQQRVTAPDKPTAKPPSQWEQVRNELRGAKAKPEDAKAPEEPALADVVLKLLADNGRHFSLPENQRVTVAITLRPTGTCMLCHVAGAGPTGGGKSAPQPGQPRGDGANLDASSSSWALLFEAQTRIGEGGQPAAKDADAKKTEASNMTHLGDIRLRQGRAQEAIDAYHKAIDLYGKLPDWKKKVASTDKEGMQYLTDVAEVHTKVAQAYLMLGDSDKAMATLKQAQLYWSRAAGGEGTSAALWQAAGPTPAALPEKLIISASKQMLDEVATGKLSFEDFKKKATVEHLTFPAAGKPTAKP